MSHFKHVMTPDEMDVAVELYRALAADFPSATEQQQARRLKTRMEALAADGEPRISRGVEERIDLEAYRQLYVAAGKLDAMRTVTLANGSTVVLSATIGVPSEGTGPGRPYQLVLFKDLTWQQAQRRAMSVPGRIRASEAELASWGEVLKLWERHPTTKTIGEACEAEGIDWRTFKLDAAANG